MLSFVKKNSTASGSSVSPSVESYPICEWNHKMVLQWMRSSCIHTDVIKAVEKKSDFGGIQLYVLTLEKCVNDLKIKERQANVFMLFVDKLRIDNVMEHGEPPIDKLKGETPPVLSIKQIPKVGNTVKNPYILTPSNNKRLETLESSSVSSTPSDSSSVIDFSKPSISIDIDGNNNTKSNQSSLLSSVPSSVNPSTPNMSNSQSTTSAGSLNINMEDRPSRDDVELTMDLLYAVGEEDEEAKYYKSIQNNIEDVNYRALMSTSPSSSSTAMEMNGPKISFYVPEIAEEPALSTSFYTDLDKLSTSLNYDSKISYGSYIPQYQPQSSGYFASRATEFKSVPSSTSVPEDDKRKKKKPKRCAPFPDKKLTPVEIDRRNYCLKKIQNLRSPIAPKLHELVAQDCVIPDRFRYKYFNPDRVDRPVHPSKLGLKVKLVITEMSTSTAHRIIRRLGSTVGALKDQQFGMYHSALIVGEFYIEFCDSSIATVRKKSSSKAVFVADIHTFRDQKEITDAFKIISEVVCEWNGTKTYDNRKANCQHFVMDILSKLGLSEGFFDRVSGSVKKYLDRLKQNGVCEMTYFVDDKKRKLITNSKHASKELKDLVKQKDISFPSHKLLDEFVYVIEKEGGIMYFEQNIQEQTDHMLLKAFDRAFWLRNEASTNNKELTKPLENERGETICPFSQVDKNGKLIDHTIHNSHLFTGTYSPEFPDR
ncbi:predicted protein [Naegleria gruberi]|uniref:Predicted protein n=1 Tax=Naegleria gruberi TaxID=5762 RepID=D2VU78_NAEGR|nr:uncharacterized protein NAEGRDRAFT_52283 [Naegleria gruberi]EFC39640.1 predicted protein [Naegleria gruberi]|eukprot:XP_002672384.1 predicted protein [Naegleria gruberi strain NEG-M]